MARVTEVAFLVLLVVSYVQSADVTGLVISGNKIVNKQGQVVKLVGVNRSGMEFACVQGNGLADGPMDQTSVNAMKAWNISVVRLPVNEDCWLAINGVKSQYAGQNYINAVKQYVDLLTSNGLAVILDLHWTGAGTTPATKQTPMPDADHAGSFWASAAKTFADYSNVLLDVFNEPYPDNNNWNSASGWQCWRDGGSSCGSIGYTAAGMQSLVTSIRNAGAKNIILLGGLAYSNSLAQWLQYKPNDPLNNTAAAVHIYNFNYCSSTSCYDQYISPVAEKVPVIIGEFGEDDCSTGFVNTLMNWADQKGIGYLGWTWNTWECGSGPSLITNYDGTATNYGAGLRKHLTGR